MTELTWRKKNRAVGVEHLADVVGGCYLCFRDHGWHATFCPHFEGHWLYLGSELPTLADAQLACAAHAAGHDPKAHRIHASGASRPGVVRGTRMTVARWRCSCGARQTGSSRSTAAARTAGYVQHWRPTLTSLANGEDDTL